VASEDLISMFHEMGIVTGVDLNGVIGVAQEAQTLLGRKLTSHSLVAGPVEWIKTGERV
jgi:hydroxymethylglutaryl-CoA lyase